MSDDKKAEAERAYRKAARDRFFVQAGNVLAINSADKELTKAYGQMKKAFPADYEQRTLEISANAHKGQ